jgi:hypothetical protein
VAGVTVVPVSSGGCVTLWQAPSFLWRSEQSGQRLIKRRLHHDLVCRRYDDPLELRKFRALGPEVQWNNVEK